MTYQIESQKLEKLVSAEVVDEQKDFVEADLSHELPTNFPKEYFFEYFSLHA